MSSLVIYFLKNKIRLIACQVMQYFKTNLKPDAEFLSLKFNKKLNKSNNINNLINENLNRTCSL